MIDAANRNNVVLVEAFTHRWNPHLRKARQLVADGTIGKVTTIDAALCFTAEPDNNVRYSTELAGGALWDAGCYAVYAARFVLAAEPIRVRGVGYDSGDWGVDTTFSGIMRIRVPLLLSQLMVKRSKPSPRQRLTGSPFSSMNFLSVYSQARHPISQQRMAFVIPLSSKRCTSPHIQAKLWKWLRKQRANRKFTSVATLEGRPGVGQ